MEFTHFRTAGGPALLKSTTVETRQKQFRVGPAKIWSSAEGASALERSRCMLPGEILKFIFSKMHVWRILREN